MIEIVKADNRHFSDYGWLKTYWLFSFSNYYDPHNIQFGALRVFNDDIVEPGTGFPTHPHEEMEIITIVLRGEMTHKDSMGNETVIKAGDVQRMSAGTGLTHSEYNLAEIPVHFFIKYGFILINQDLNHHMIKKHSIPKNGRTICFLLHQVRIFPGRLHSTPMPLFIAVNLKREKM